MKLQIQTLTGETQKVEAESQDTILDLKVCRSLLVCLIIIHNKQDEVVDPDFDRRESRGGGGSTEFHTGSKGFCLSLLKMQLECIPVGCVPPLFTVHGGLPDRPPHNRHSSWTETPDRRTPVKKLPPETSFVGGNKYLQAVTEADPGFSRTVRPLTRKGRQHICGQNLPKTARKLDWGLGCVQNVTL